MNKLEQRKTTIIHNWKISP